MMRLFRHVLAVISVVSFAGAAQAGIVATFDWQEVTTGTQWWYGYNYSETDNGVTMQAGGRAASYMSTNNVGFALKASYAQDAAPGTFVMAVGGTGTAFKVLSIDISANDGGSSSNGTPSVQGMLEGVEQWSLLPTLYTNLTYTSATTGDISLPIDQIIWNGPVNESPLIWNNQIDNLTIETIDVVSTLVDITALAIEDAVGVSVSSVYGADYRLEYSLDGTNFAYTGAYATGDGSEKILFDPALDTTGRTYRVRDGVFATFDWAEGVGLDMYTVGYTYSEDDNGLTLVHGGRATVGNGIAEARKFTYNVDSNAATFAVQAAGADQFFTVDSIDIAGDIENATVPNGALLVQGMLNGVEQWAIVPAEDNALHTYTTPTSGDMSLTIDQVVWNAPYSNPGDTNLVWNNRIDNLKITRHSNLIVYDWAEVSGTNWFENFGYTETKQGATLVSSGRAFAFDGGDGVGGLGSALKAAYSQDVEAAYFNVQVGSVTQQFSVFAIDISANDGVGQFTPTVEGKLGGVQQWSITPVANSTFARYTSPTTGDMSLLIDQIVWNTGVATNPNSVFNNAIDNLAVVLDPGTITFSWNEFTGSLWTDGFFHKAARGGLTLTHNPEGGRATANHDSAGEGWASKFTYNADSVPGVFAMQIAGVSQPFTVKSIDIKGDVENGTVPNGTLLVQGMLGAVEQWAIDPIEDNTNYTYTTPTSGDMALQIDEIVWSTPYSDVGDANLVWNNQIDNLVVVPATDLSGGTEVTLVDAAVVEAQLLSVADDTELLASADLVGGAWQAAGDTLVEPGLSSARYVDPFTSGAQDNYAIGAELVSTYFFDDFEGPDMGWTKTGAGLTVWEQGTPNYNEPLFMIYITNAASGTEAWGTDLDADYEPGTDITLTSPAISLSNAVTATVEWMERRDIDDTSSTDAGIVNIINLDEGTTNLIHTSSGANPDWELISAPVPASALGDSIKVEFHFLDDGTDSPKWAGWYVDDVRVKN